MGLPVRCTNRIGGKTCFTRKSLAMHPDQYAETRYQPKCPSCGARKWRVDRWRLNNEVRGNGDTCGCGGYHFIHRRGSKFCYDNPDAEQHQDERYK